MKKNGLIIIGIILLIVGMGVVVDSALVKSKSKNLYEEWYQQNDLNNKTLFNEAQSVHQLSKTLLPVGVMIGAAGFILIYGGIYKKKQNPYD